MREGIADHGCTRTERSGIGDHTLYINIQTCKRILRVYAENSVSVIASQLALPMASHRDTVDTALDR